MRGSSVCFFDVPSSEIARCLMPSAKLLASGLLQLDRFGCLDVQDRLASLIRRDIFPAADFYDQLLGSSRPESLPWEAFAHLGQVADIAASVLRAALAGKDAGVSILLYGPPGTGKTSFAATLAARVGASLRPVAEADEEGDEPQRHDRLAGLRLAQRLAPPGSTVLLFDEAEDLFVRRGTQDDEPVTSSRVFIHRLLEELTVPVIWTANDISVLGPAVLRRMTMCLELKVPNLATRTRLWRRMGEAEGVVLQDTDAARLARLIPAAPAVASGAMRATRLAGGGAETARLIVEGVARAVRGGELPVPEKAPDAMYDPALVNADCDLAALAADLVRPGATRAVSFLLSGPPGAGKSAWVRHLAGRMGMPVLHKRASDLLDPFVGGTEQNIAGAFAEAREAQAFLVFDEADSLSAGTRGCGAELGNQPGQRDADLDGEPRAAFCLHHQPGRAAGSRQPAPVPGQVTVRLADRGSSQACVPPVLRLGRSHGPGRSADTYAGGFCAGPSAGGGAWRRAGPSGIAAFFEGRMPRAGRHPAPSRIRPAGCRLMIARVDGPGQHGTMRYAPAERLLRLARHLAGTRTGLTLDEMATELEVGRRTAERLRDSLVAMFPQMDWWDDEERVRRWRLPGSALVGVIELRAEAVAAIETAARECDARGEDNRAALLREASTTLRAVMRPDALRQAEPDIAALMEAEGIAMRPGPRPTIAAGVLSTLRRAILGMQLVVVRYANPDSAEPAARILCPYGLLYGGRGWLVAHVDELPEMRLWRLDRIMSVDLLDRGFSRREDFSLGAYAAQSFGVFQEDPMDVELQFTQQCAEDAAKWLFHPSQRINYEDNGTLTVHFHAGGSQEIIWHLFTWGTEVKIVSPDSLRKMLAQQAAAIARHNAEELRLTSQES